MYSLQCHLCVVNMLYCTLARCCSVSGVLSMEMLTQDALSLEHFSYWSQCFHALVPSVLYKGCYTILWYNLNTCSMRWIFGWEGDLLSRDQRARIREPMVCVGFEAAPTRYYYKGFGGGEGFNMSLRWFLWPDGLVLRCLVEYWDRTDNSRRS